MNKAHVVKDDDSYYAVDDSYEALKAFITNYRKENGRTYHRLSDGSKLIDATVSSCVTC